MVTGAERDTWRNTANSQLAFCPFVIVLHQLLQPQGFSADVGRKGRVFCVKNKYLCYREICGWTAPSANHSCKMHEEKGDLCCRAVLLSSASFSFSFFSSIVRSRSSWAFLYRYSRLSLTSRRSCLTATQQKNTEKQTKLLRLKAHAPTKYRVFTFFPQ